MWPDRSALRIGLGCMRLPADDDALARATIAAAAQAGVTIFDTARAYGDTPGAGERLLASALRECGADGRARIVTKGGMTRPGGAWVPDGRAKAIRADCEASLEALGGLAIDLWLLHAPDPRVPWATSVRALARLAEEGLVARVGLSNVNLRQLDEARAAAPVAAVSVALGVLDDRPVRGGVLGRCAEHGIAVLAHSPLGGPRRCARVAADPALAEVGAAAGATAAEVALAWLLGLSGAVTAVVGARRPETARSAARAGGIALSDAQRAAVDGAFGLRPGSAAPAPPPPGDGDEVVLVMGIPGAGKSRLAARYAARGYRRLNRDEHGGSLTGIATRLDELLGSGSRRVVLDNTYLGRAARSRIVEACARHGVAARCVWLDTPLASAQVNLVERMLSAVGRLPEPDELTALCRSRAGVMAPTSQMRALRELEPPGPDEGFAAIERVTFAREERSGVAGLFVAAPALASAQLEAALTDAGAGAPCLLFDWRPGGTAAALDEPAARLRALVRRPVAVAVCPHEGGPPRCWCRPPLPGLVLAFATAHAVDPGRSLLIGTRPAHRALAAAVGARHAEVSG